MTSRREAIAVTLAAAFAGTVGPSQAQSLQSTFVLVHGAFSGGWMWRRVADLLEKRGHKVFTPTLTGLGERSHLLDARVNLTTHIADIANVISWERLENVVLVGHSYGGLVIAGVAEKAERAISSIVFVDAFVPQNGQSALDIEPAFAETFRAAQQRGEVALPPASAVSLGLNASDLAWVDALTTPLPIATWTEKIALTGAYERIAKKTYVRAMRYPEEVFERTYLKYRVMSGWRTYEVASGHAVMVDMPERLTEILLEVA